MIIVTGGAGFIGSNLVNELCKYNYNVVVCDYKEVIKKQYFSHFNLIKDFVEPAKLKGFICSNKIDMIFHLGAISSTIFKNNNILWLNNTIFSINLWRLCSEKNIRLIYASSAATYGDGKVGFKDLQDYNYIKSLNPLNVYGWTKQQADVRKLFLHKYLKISPPQWIGIKFFNVYGENETHKGQMKSVILKTYEEILENHQTSLFKSHNKNYKDGEQKRDFIYIKDCIKVLLWFMDNKNISGIYNLGTGQSRTFFDLVYIVYKEMNKNLNLKFINMPDNIRKQYQYETKADLSNIRKIGYKDSFFSLEEGIKNYIKSLINN